MLPPLRCRCFSIKVSYLCSTFLVLLPTIELKIKVMSETTRETPRHVSVTGLGPDEVAERLESLAIEKVSRVGQRPDVVVVELGEEQSDARAALLVIRKLLKEDGQAELVIPDDYGNELYPTGTIQVRFVDTPSNENLNALCMDLGLKFIERNEFQPKQAALEAIDKMTNDLEGDIRRLEERPEVSKAWPEVRALYHRQ